MRIGGYKNTLGGSSVPPLQRRGKKEEIRVDLLELMSFIRSSIFRKLSSAIFLTVREMSTYILNIIKQRVSELVRERVSE